MNPEFFTLHRDLPREGPGEPADVEWALRVARTPPDARVLDAACGPGADALTLAQTLRAAQIEAVDGVASFVTAASARTAHLGDRVQVTTGDMFDAIGPFDLIWCAGAVYFQGVEASLTKFRPLLAEGGRIAFSEVVWLRPDAPKVLKDFWAAYPGMTDVPGVEAVIDRAGFTVLDKRILGDRAWENYYGPLEKRVEYLRKTHVNQDLAEVLEDNDLETAMRRQYPDHFGYALFVVARA